MRLLRLKLENWRGVAAQELELKHGVTLIEGRNEIGKSSLVEALGLLFRELDSSKKATVRAVQPVGQDVGSTVEAEIETGPYRFTYSKTYNRTPSTTLHVHTPRREQLTGREAHERARALLEETIDIGLWQALQVEQGLAIAQTNLKDSHGLARALDAAAGTAASGEDHSALLERVAAEYGRFFTERSGKPKFTDLEQRVASLTAQIADTEAALRDIDDNVMRSQSLQTELQQMDEELPRLQQQQADHDRQWHAIAALQTKITVAQSECANHQLQLEQAQQALKTRQLLAAAVVEGRAALGQADTALTPLAEARAQCGNAVAQADAALAKARRDLQALIQRQQSTAADVQHMQRMADVQQLTALRERLVTVIAQKAEATEHLAKTRVDAAGLTAIQSAELALREARGRLDVAASKVEIQAHRPLDLEINGTPASLAAKQTHSTPVAADLTVKIDTLATVTIRPSANVVDLQQQADDAQSALDQLFKRYSVDSLVSATAQHAVRRDAEDAMQRNEQMEQEIRRSVPPGDLDTRIQTLRADTEAYLASRDDATPLPESLDQAQLQLADLQHQRDELALAVDAAVQGREQARHDAAEADTRYRLQEQRRDGQRAQLDAQVHALETARAEVADAALQETVEQAATRLRACQTKTDDLQRELSACAPDTVEALRDNTRAAVARLQQARIECDKALAAVKAKLEQAQAEGLFERLNQETAQLCALREQLARTQRQATAARRLWDTLQRHRQTARRAYIRPLTERIERLGRIVFGPDFHIEMDDELTIVSRTLNGSTVPFDALSVGAREQIGILTRLAAAQLVSGTGGVPLILDDTLGYSDPERLHTMGAVLDQAGRDTQVIVLTCSPARFTHIGNAHLIRLT